MVSKAFFKPTRTEIQRKRTHEAWREIVDAQAKARDAKMERLTQARVAREAELAGLPVPEPEPVKPAKKARKKK